VTEHEERSLVAEQDERSLVTEHEERSLVAAEYAALPICEFGFPGELRDRLIAAILSGRKTATGCLLLEFESTANSRRGWEIAASW
jgi:uncharacterized protein YhfF